MKSSKSVVRTAATLLCLVVFPSASFAATPLNNPTALAVDTKGNLWVANQGGDNILKFNPSYMFQPKATIITGVNAPTSIAFDPSGNLWVVDSVDGDVIKYTNGIQNTAATITDSIGRFARTPPASPDKTEPR
jgi:DNA-binding beta-propeller fold protein YncE